MASREQKTRKGGWNGGQAPYGYQLEGDYLVIEESEVELIRLIYDKYVYTNLGINGVAK